MESKFSNEGASVYLDELKDQPKENLHLLLDTIEGINRTMELKTLLLQSMEATRIVMRSTASSLMLLDEDSGELYVSLPTGPVKDDIKGKSIPRHKGIGGWVVDNRQPFLSNDVENEDKFFGDLAESFTTRNMLCVPLINRDNEVIGVLQAINRRKNKDFTAHDIPIFQALASHVAFAIERTREIEDLHSELKEKEVMLTEIHHRIKNNLAAVTGLIELEMPEVKDDYARQVLKSTYSRIQSMIQVHDMLCEAGIQPDINLGNYLKQLTAKVHETMDARGCNYEFETASGDLTISTNKALLCGLILNELLVNTYKHAFEGQVNGNVIINLSYGDEQVHLKISDNGVGLSEEIDLTNNKSIGMWIVDVLLKKLDGHLETEPGEEKGVAFHVSFPI